MIIKLVWTTIMFLISIGILYFAAEGLNIPIAYYEKSETIIPSNVR